MIKLLRLVAKLKNFAMRSAQYFSIVNSYLLIVTFLTVRGINFNYFVLLGALVLLVVVVGTIDYYFVLRYELEHINKMNDVKADLDIIKKHLGIEK